jgi:hypothetical protein
MNLTCRCKWCKERNKLSSPGAVVKQETHGEGEMEREGGDGKETMMKGR